MEFNTDENRRQGKIRKYAGERKHEKGKEKRIMLKLIQFILCARQRTKCFVSIISFNPFNNLMKLNNDHPRL